MNSDAIKRLIEDASASTGQPDAHWEASGVDRLYFHNPADPETSGAVDVQRSGESVARIKLELWIPPHMVAEIVALVTGAAPSVWEKMGAIVRKEVLPLESRRMPATVTELPPVALGYVAEPVAPANENGTALEEVEDEKKEPERVKLPVTKQVLADELRRLELAELVKQQEADERAEAAQEEREEEEGEPDELDVEALAL